MYVLLLTALLSAPGEQQPTVNYQPATQTAVAATSSCTGKLFRTRRASCTGTKTASCTGTKAATCTGTTTIVKTMTKTRTVRTRGSCAGSSCTGAKQEAKPPVTTKNDIPEPIQPVEKIGNAYMIHDVIVDRGTHLYRRSVYYDPK